MKHNLLSGLMHFDQSIVAPDPLNDLPAHASVATSAIGAVIAELSLEQLAVGQLQDSVSVLVVEVELT